MTDLRPNTAEPMDTPHGDVVPEREAKQGNRGLHVLTILVVSLALVILAFGALGVFRHHPAKDATPAAAAARTVGTPPGG